MTKIKSLQVNLPMHSECYFVGKEIGYDAHITATESAHRLVTEIKDVGVEFENSIHSFYEIFVDGQVFRRIENTPVTVEYEVD